MAQKQPSPRPNRYKKNGKGGFAFAVFLIAVCVLMIGGYLLQHYLQKPAQQNKATVQQLPVPQSPRSSSTVSPSTQKPAENATSQTQTKNDYYSGDIHPAQLPSQTVQRPTSGRAELAVIVDDMGSSLQEARSLAAIGLPINFAIIPGLRHDREVALFATGKGIEVLLHMPMQPKEYPQRRLEPNGLLLDQSDEELRSRVRGYLELLPQAVGANNHMGSGFTENADKMRVVLNVLKEHGLFFVDSITTPKTTGLKVAAEIKLASARRDVFLDNEQNEEYIRGQLNQAVARARKNGRAIAICHPHPVTVATLTKALPELQSKGISLVKVTRLITAK